ALRLGRLGLRREQIRARARFAHADREAHLAATDARHDLHLDVLGRVFEQDGAALAVGDKVQPHRGICYAELLGHDKAFEKAALVPAIYFRPGHADPAFRADAAAELGARCLALANPQRIESTGRDLLRDE